MSYTSPWSPRPSTLDHKTEALWRLFRHATGNQHACRKVSAAGSMVWPHNVRTTEILLDSGYCIDAPDVIPTGGSAKPAVGAGTILRDRFFF